MAIELKVPTERPIRPGSYRARIVRVEEVPSRFDVEKTSIVLSYEIIEGEHAGRRLRKFYTPSLSSKAKLGQLVRRLNSRLPEGGTFDLETLVGQEVELLLTEGQHDDGEPFVKVADVFAPEKAG